MITDVLYLTARVDRLRLSRPVVLAGRRFHVRPVVQWVQADQADLTVLARLQYKCRYVIHTCMNFSV